ncbi:MAG: hypothetical protein GXP63_07615 [DPANN group archaeon]|nr:hypothetical protein [DPANN group archaeon]
MIATIEEAVGKKAVRDEKPMQQGDVDVTYADIGLSQEQFGYAPETTLQEGITSFISWYLRER